MTTYSKADLRNRALAEIGVLAAEEPAKPDMAAYVDPVCQQMIEGLDDENCLIFNPATSVSTQVIPGRIMRAMAALLGWEISPAYGVSRTAVREDLLNGLRRSVLQGSDPIPVQAEYF